MLMRFTAADAAAYASCRCRSPRQFCLFFADFIADDAIHDAAAAAAADFRACFFADFIAATLSNTDAGEAPPDADIEPPIFFAALIFFLLAHFFSAPRRCFTPRHFVTLLFTRAAAMPHHDERYFLAAMLTPLAPSLLPPLRAKMLNIYGAIFSAADAARYYAAAIFQLFAAAATFYFLSLRHCFHLR